MVPAEPPTPRRPAASGPVRHTQRPGVRHPPPTPPPAESAVEAAAARSICPLAGPGRADAMVNDEGTADLTRPSVEKGRGRESRDEEGAGGTRRPAPGPPLPCASPRRAAWEGCRARARVREHWRFLPSPSRSFLKLHLNLHEPPPCSFSRYALLPFSAPPSCNLEYFVRARRAGHLLETLKQVGRAWQDAVARRLGPQNTALP